LGLAVRIAQLAERAGIALARLQIDQLVSYLKLLRRWNAAMNLTALDVENLPAAALERLILEPLIAATLITTRAGAWFDLGSGGGSPALPLKVALPGLALTMIESRGRKAAFLRETVREMGLAGAEVLSVRIEALSRQVVEKSVQLVTMRGIRVDASVAGALRHLLAPLGEVVLFGTGVDELRAIGLTPARTANDVTLLRSSALDVPRGTSAG
jgi:16S rRNA (guanine527-N7)-methyltransferase